MQVRYQAALRPELFDYSSILVQVEACSQFNGSAPGSGAGRFHAIHGAPPHIAHRRRELAVFASLGCWHVVIQPHALYVASVVHHFYEVLPDRQVR